MGNTHSDIDKRTSMSSVDGINYKSKHLREHKRNGVVTVKISNNANNRRNTDTNLNHIVTPKGSIVHGSLCNPYMIQKALTSSGYPILAPGEIPLSDSRAHKLLVSYCHGWHVIPFPEVFSRHSGTCIILGDRNITSTPFAIKTGDCFRLGSVGLVVSEMRVEGKQETRLDAKTLQFLKDEALAFDTQEEMAALATDEERMSMSLSTANVEETPIDRGGVLNGEKYVCYMCYESHSTEEDALVAPCDCKGDTRYLHVQCLQKWYHSNISGAQAQVIRTTGTGAPACKICGVAYKTCFRRQDGRKASLLEMETDGPYLSLVVVTKHDTNPGLFNTKFRLNFGRSAANPQAVDGGNTIVIGRSSSCNMILDYRTVSTIHAKISYSDGKFYLSDQRSSNGTMVYLQDPLPLSYSVPMRFRMGRTTLTLQAKRTWTAALRSALSSSNNSDQYAPTSDDIMHILSSVTTSGVLMDNKRSLSARTLNDASGDISDMGEAFELIQDPAENEETVADNMNTGTLTNMNSVSFNGRAMIVRGDSEDVMTTQYNGSVASVSPAPEDADGNDNNGTSFNTPSDTRHRPLTPPTHNSYLNSGTKANSEELTPVQSIQEAGENNELSPYQKRESFSKAAIRSFLFDDNESTEIVSRKTAVDEEKSSNTSRIGSPQVSLNRRSYRAVSPAPSTFGNADSVNLLLNANENETENCKIKSSQISTAATPNRPVPIKQVSGSLVFSGKDSEVSETVGSPHDKADSKMPNELLATEPAANIFARDRSLMSPVKASSKELWLNDDSHNKDTCDNTSGMNSNSHIQRGGTVICLDNDINSLAPESPRNL